MGAAKTPSEGGEPTDVHYSPLLGCPEQSHIHSQPFLNTHSLLLFFRRQISKMSPLMHFKYPAYNHKSSSSSTITIRKKKIKHSLNIVNPANYDFCRIVIYRNILSLTNKRVGWISWGYLAPSSAILCDVIAEVMASSHQAASCTEHTSFSQSSNQY